MEYLSESDLLPELPLILAGPILRRTDPDAVTVWLALKKSCQVNLSILATHSKGTQLGRCILQGRRKTVALGAHLHLVAVTARSLEGEHAACRLKHDRLYAYDLTFLADQSYDLPSALYSPGSSASSSYSDTSSSPHQPISYFAHQKPTFSLPPTELAHLKIAHGSCRKPHGKGFDALSILDSIVKSTAHDSQSRPHQLFLTGDQIYGDDVADPLLWLATSLGNVLLGWTEQLPVEETSVADAFSSSLSWRTPKHLPAGKRADYAIEQAGLTAGIEHQKERTTSHLFSFGEYCSAYLLAYSPACWPAHLPTGRTATQGRKNIRRWDKDKRNMEQFVYSLWKVRRLLANIPTYTIFDDHDVSDDWNLNQQWCLRVLGSALGKRTVRNAMHAYALFQAWGNTPEQFDLGENGEALLIATEQWSQGAGKAAAEKAIATYLGLSETDSHTGLPLFSEESDVWVLSRQPQALRWHYTVRSPCHEVVVLDTRTQRGYPKNEDPLAPPMLLSPKAFKVQLVDPLSQSPPKTDYDATDYATFIVAPTNVFGMRVLDWIQQWHLDRRKVFTADVGDSWNFHTPALATLLTTLFRYRKRVIVLSGDIHYSSAVQVSYQDLKTGDRATLTQLTSSALKNEELLTQIIHTRLKDWLLPEKVRQWIGWHAPPDMMEISQQPTDPSALATHAMQYSTHTPQWQCQLRWLHRQESVTASAGFDLTELIPPTRRKQVFSFFYALSKFKFWQARWFQSGKEVIGRNNIGLVELSLNSQQQASLQPGSVVQNYPIVQKHYWFSAWQPTQVVHGRFERLIGQPDSH